MSLSFQRRRRPQHTRCRCPSGRCERTKPRDHASRLQAACPPPGWCNKGGSAGWQLGLPGGLAVAWGHRRPVWPDPDSGRPALCGQGSSAHTPRGKTPTGALGIPTPRAHDRPWDWGSQVPDVCLGWGPQLEPLQPPSQSPPPPERCVCCPRERVSPTPPLPTTTWKDPLLPGTPRLSLRTCSLRTGSSVTSPCSQREGDARRQETPLLEDPQAKVTWPAPQDRPAGPALATILCCPPEALGQAAPIQMFLQLEWLGGFCCSKLGGSMASAVEGHPQAPTATLHTGPTSGEGVRDTAGGGNTPTWAESGRN